MGVTSDMLNSGQMPHSEILDWDWIRGALAGLDISSERDPAWLWKPFLEDLKSMQDLYDIKPLKPWQETEEQSILDSLGGYVSITASISGTGIRFPLPSEIVKRISEYFPAMDIEVHSHGITIPWDQIDAFTSLVQIRGPVEEMILEVSS